MHHPRSHAMVFRFRLSALLLLAYFLLAPMAGGLLAYSLSVDDIQLTMIGGSVAAFCMLLLVLQWTVAAGLGCPLCRTPVLTPKACMKHRRARTLLGSHRLRVALAIVFQNRFRCPYCNESTSLELRETIGGVGVRRPLQQ